LIQIVNLEGVQREFFTERNRVDSRRMATPFAQKVTKVPSGAADVEHARARCDAFERKTMRAFKVQFRRVWRPASRRGRAVELPIVKERPLLRTRLETRDEDVFGVDDAVDVGNLVTVVRRNRNFLDTQAADEQLNDDLRVEMKRVAVEMKRNARSASVEYRRYPECHSPRCDRSRRFCSVVRILLPTNL